MNYAIILAGGKGLRTGTKTPKQFLNIEKNTPMIVKTIKAFNSTKEVDAICVVCLDKYISKVNSFVEKFKLKKVQLVVKGGSTRQQSVFAGLNALKDAGAKENDIVLIHDCARPFVSKRIILDNIKQCEKYNAVITAIQSTDSVFISTDNHKVGKYLERKELYNCQTPQTFKFRLIYLAHQTAKSNGIKDATDDAMLVMRIGGIVRIVEGEASNKKVTFKEDF